MARGSGVGFTAAIIAISLAFLGDGPVRMLGIAAAIVGVGYGGARLMRLTWPSRWRRETVATRLTRGDCGACGLHIEDMPRDGNGCVRCPDCGATWLVDRLGGRVDDGW
ncbi:MAG: hypothetical protein CMJ31_12415 [Phycisphaerae bacterium]|nr:hypothetical protein [Phycisphaerae bacterium]